MGRGDTLSHQLQQVAPFSVLPITCTGQEVLNTLDSCLLSVPSWNPTGRERKRERKGKAAKPQSHETALKESPSACK